MAQSFVSAPPLLVEVLREREQKERERQSAQIAADTVRGREIREWLSKSNPARPSNRDSVENLRGWLTNGRGVWLAYHSDMSGVVPFGSEADALRYAVQWSMQVKHVPYGDDQWMHREPAADGRAPCYCGHVASRHPHRLECGAADCDCSKFRALRSLT